MACCGHRGTFASTGDRRAPASLSVAAPQAGRFFLRNIGARPVNVLGPASGLRYRFVSGAVVEVDPRDAPSLEFHPELMPA
jgi:hypothetical protein